VGRQKKKRDGASKGKTRGHPKREESKQPSRITKSPKQKKKKSIGEGISCKARSIEKVKGGLWTGHAGRKKKEARGEKRLKNGSVTFQKGRKRNWKR